MNPSMKPILLAFLSLACLAAAVSAQPDRAQNEPAHGETRLTNCPHVCEGEYALCIAASCDSTGTCGVDSDGVPCDQKGLDAGTCGPCYIFEGEACSVERPCSEIPEGLHSLYSPRLLNEHQFKWTALDKKTIVLMNCMDVRCKRTHQTVQLKGGKVETATCECQLWSDQPAVLYLQAQACEVTSSVPWSTGPPMIAGPSCDG